MVRGDEGDRVGGVEWYYAIDDNQHGPVSESQLVELIWQERVPTRALVWNSTMADWTPVTGSQFAGLVRSSNPLPPPASAPLPSTSPVRSAGAAASAGPSASPRGGPGAVDVFLLQHGRYFPPERLTELREALRLRDDGYLGTLLPALPLRDPHLTLLLAVFLGMIGVDRFFLGDVRGGLLKLCTFGGLYLWWFVDIFSAYRRTHERNLTLVGLR